MPVRVRHAIPIPLVTTVLAFAVISFVWACPAVAGVSLSETPAQRAEAVSGIDHPPILSQPNPMTVRGGRTLDQAISASDPDGDPITFAKTAGPAYMTVINVSSAMGTGDIRLQPGGLDTGSATGRVQASDGTLTDEKSFSITVTPDAAPSLSPIYGMSLPAGTLADQTLSAYDSDNDPVTFSKVSGPNYMTVTTGGTSGSYTGGNLHLAPLVGDVGNTSGTVRASDGALSTDQSVSISVTSPNRPPVLAQPANMTLTVGEIGIQTVTAADPDFNYVNIIEVSGPAYVSFFGNSNLGTATATIRAQPGAGDVGVASVFIQASDSYSSDTKSFTITVQAGNFPGLCPRESFSKSDLSLGSGPIEVQAADLDGDGFQDLVAEIPSLGEAMVVMGAGDGSFSGSPTGLTVPGRPSSGVIVDLNGDGILDLALANMDSNNISVFLGNGSGGFGPRQDFPCGGSTQSIATGDLNRDGKMDLVVARSGLNSIAVLRGTGNGSFGPATSIPVGTSPYMAQVVDLNHDGALDIVVANTGDNDLSVLLNNGLGGFGTRTDYPTGPGPVGLAAGDLNGDGMPDIAVTSNNSNYVTVLLGNGSGALGPGRNFGTDTGAGQVAIADLNGDGHPDLAIANTYGGDVSVLLGDGSGSFAPQTYLPAAYGAFGIAAADVNDDLRPDLVVANYYSGGLSILLNQCAPLRDHPPVVHAPRSVTVNEGAQVAFSVTANDPDGPALTTFTASLAGLPLGNNATFTGDVVSGTGSITWTPTYQDARPTPYTVTFTATDILSGSGSTQILVQNTNRAPVANAGGPYSAFAGAPLTLNGSGSSDPDGDALAYSWIYGDGSTGTGSTPVHTYASIGVFGVALTVTDGTLSGIATTTATIVNMLQARAFTENGNKSIHLSSGKPRWCVNIEPIGQSYANVEVDPSTVVMKSPGTGSVDQIHAIQDKISISDDRDGNGIDEIEACFTKDDLRQLFSKLKGSSTVTVTFEGSLFAGGLFRAQMDVGVVASGGGQLAASLSPNPLNPEAVLTFSTEEAGLASVDLFDVNGRVVRHAMAPKTVAAGYHDVRIDGRDEHGERLASGIYFYRVRVGGNQITGQLAVLK